MLLRRILRHEWRLLAADATLWLVAGVFAAAIGYGTFNGVRWVALPAARRIAERATRSERDSRLQEAAIVAHQRAAN